MEGQHASFIVKSQRNLKKWSRTIDGAILLLEGSWQG